MQTKVLLLSLFSALTMAQDPGQPDFYNTVAEIFEGPDCDPASKVWNDPIFGRGGRCQPLDRNDNTPDILSYRVISNNAGCTTEIFADDGCTSRAFAAPPGRCITAPAGTPFLTAFVTCPFPPKE